jgi:hypothetical protein
VTETAELGTETAADVVACTSGVAGVGPDTTGAALTGPAEGWDVSRELVVGAEPAVVSESGAVSEFEAGPAPGAPGSCGRPDSRADTVCAVDAMVALLAHAVPRVMTAGALLTFTVAPLSAPAAVGPGVGFMDRPPWRRERWVAVRAGS